MKILFLLSSFGSGGSERTVAYISEYMAENGHDVTILTISGEVFYDIHDRVKIQTLNIPSKPKNLIDKYIKVAKRFILTRRAVAKAHPDVVFCILPFSAKFILGQKKKCGYKLMSAENSLPQSYSEKLMKYIQRVYRECDGVVFQTERARDFYPADIQNNGRIINNAVGNPYVYKVPECLSRRPVVSAMGRICAVKDYPNLIKAFSIVLKSHPEFTLEIYGEGPDTDKLIEYADSLGIKDKVIFCGAHTDAIMRIYDSSCYVLSSQYEGMPNALMEAMAVGLPCVSTDCPNGPAELIEDGVNGVLVPVSDPDALATAILKMIDNKDFAEFCGSNAKKILETHCIDKKAKEYADYITEIVSKR